MTTTYRGAYQPRIVLENILLKLFYLGEIRDREKTMRSLKKNVPSYYKATEYTPTAFDHYEALDGKTPSEMCGIIIQGKNKWKTLIENASKTKEE